MIMVQECAIVTATAAAEGEGGARVGGGRVGGNAGQATSGRWAMGLGAAARALIGIHGLSEQMEQQQQES